jgi:hypothetical protein
MSAFANDEIADHDFRPRVRWLAGRVVLLVASL